MDLENVKKFHSLDQSEIVGENYNSRRSNRERYVWIFLVLALIAAVIGVSVYFSENYEKKGSAQSGSSGAQTGDGVSTTAPKTTSTATGTVTTKQPTDTGQSTNVPSTTVPPTEDELRKRIDCIPEAQGGAVKATTELCDKRGCIYSESNKKGVPDCYFSQDIGYKVAGVSDTALGLRVDLVKKKGGPFGDDLERAVFVVEMLGDDIIYFKFDDPVFHRYKVPIELNLPTQKGENTKYRFKITNNETFAFQIIRNSTNKVLWDTGVGGLVLSDQFLQISTSLPSENVYGFGENMHTTFRHNLNYKTWPMFARDQPPSHDVDHQEANLYGVHPFYMCMEEGGHSHGVLLLNSNAMDYSFTPLPMLTYRTIGGILDFYMFLGPEPENVVQQYTGVIGRPFMPPYYALGFQLCRYGYKNVDNMEAALNRTLKYNIPLDIQYADIDHFDANMDFTLDHVKFGRLPQYFRDLQSKGMRTVIILDPAIISNMTRGRYPPYDNLTAVRGSVMWPADLNVAQEDQDSTGALLGYVWPSGKSVFPDFFKKETQDVWTNLIVQHHNVVPFDALWIDMNEPANFGTNLERPWNWPEAAKPYWSLHCPTNSKLEDPPYRTKAGYHFDKDGKQSRLSDKTICMVSRQGDNGQYRHYDVHNLYGWSQTLPTLKGARSATGERSFVLSRSTYPGSGKYAGHWLGDNDSKWSDMHASIIGMLEFNLFGIPYIGADICGYWGNTTLEMCKRWQQLGAFYPFSRNHNQFDSTDQDPGTWPEVGVATRQAMETRYWLLPYLYTLFHKAHTIGGTVVRPVFHEFPKDTQLYNLDRQFLWGNALMIVPILEEGATLVSYALPEGVWYDFYDHTPHYGPNYNMARTVDADSKIGLFVRGGTILPMQKPENNTHFSRKNQFKLLVALDAVNTAEGEMFWDDGNSVDTAENGNYFFANFKAEMNHLAMTIQHENIPQPDTVFFGSVEVINAPSGVKRVYCDGQNFNFTYTGQTLVITDLRLPLTRDFKIYWSTESDDERTRHDCIPEAQGRGVHVTEQLCTIRGCVYNPSASQGPKCYFNLVNYGYKVIKRIETDLGFMYQLQRKTRPSPFSDQGSPDIQTLNFTVEMRSRDVLRFKFDDARGGRYEVPTTLNLGSDKALDPRYEVKVTSEDPFAFQVVRRSNREILWDTGVGGLTFSEHYLHLSTKLPSRNIYGFGENIHHSLRHDLNYRSWPLFARDQPTSWGDYLNHYGVHPFYMCIEDTVNGGHAHGVLLLNSNAQDYSFTPLPMLTYRTIGGILDFYMFLGPEPENVVQQYTGAIGRPYMPPYWALGFQLCRYGYNNISNLQDAVEKTRIANIPHDVQYADIDHMYEQRDFTLNNKDFPGLNDYFKKLQSGGMHIIIILDPTLISNVSGYEPYIRMNETNSNIKWDPSLYIPQDSANEQKDLLGYVWPVGKVVFPDFFKSSTKQVWKELIVKHHNNYLTFDGLWIDMNEPANFGTNEERPWNWPEAVKPYWSLNCTLAGNYYEHPPYRTMAAFAHDDPGNLKMISEKTICMRALQGEHSEFKHYDVHSLYGWSQTQPTLDAVRAATRERGIVITRSTFPGSGKYGGHWLGDNNSAWKDLQRSIIGSLEFNFFGIPYIGADICGFMVDTTPELCKRWMQLGAFYTFSRNHNGINYLRQDPGSFAPETGVAEASRIAMETRYWLLPYLYTLFHHAHIRGNTVIRPLHHEFADDVATFDIDKQFLWGPALMISPILYEGQTAINLYMPRGPWYDWYTGEEHSSQGYMRRPVQPDSPIPLHVRAGHILPLQQYANNTHFSRQNPFTLLVALKNSENAGRGYVADGDLFWDDGASVDTYETDHYYYARFSSMSNKLHMTVEHNTAGSSMNGLHIGSVKVMGVRSNVKVIYIGNKAHSDLTYNSTSMVLQVNNLQLPLTTDFTIEWREYGKPTQEEMERLSCYPEFTNEHVTEPMCRSRGCIYHSSNTLPFIPSCYFNRKDFGYFRAPADPNVLKLNKRTQGNTTMFGKDVFALLVQIEHLTDSILHIKIVDELNKRYNVPLPLQMIEKNNSTDTLYNINITEAIPSIEFTMQITRKSTGKKIWDTSAGPLIFSDQYLQLSTYLASDNFYGLGEHRHMHLKHDMDYRTWPIFTRDAPVNSPDYTNLYGAHPFYINIEDDDGNTHGVFFLNSNAMELLLDPNPRLTYRTIGGVLDFYFFMGPTVEYVVQQYQQLIGTPVLVPYWALGFQLCRWGYNSLDNLKVAVERTRAAGIPHDIQYADIDHMDERKDFSYDSVAFAGLPEYIQELQAGGMHFIIILDPALISNNTDYWPYETGVERDVYIKWPHGQGPVDSRPNSTSDIMLGYVWPKGKTAFPDFLLNKTQDWWADTIVEWHKTIKFDGLWIDMNEPANFDTNGQRPWNWPEKDTPYWTLKCTLDNNTWDLPPYKPRSLLGDVLSDKTLCMIGEQKSGTFRHYDVHSLYGWSQTQPTSIGLQRATGKRGIVISRSTYPSSGHYGGHWLGDNDSFWRNLHDSIIGIIEFNLFGIPYIGADICGFFSEPSVEMCQRWMQLGAFYTFSRNHNGLNMKEQDPSVFGPHVADSSKRAMEIRYSLLPFLYTQFYRVHTQGGTVIRSMFHNFPKEPRTRSIDTQFMWGDSFLIAPVVEQGHLHKDVYLPEARWFDHYTGAEIKEHGTTVTVNAPRDHIPLFWRGGYIIPTQKPANNTVFSRKNTLGLMVIPDHNGTATGDLFWDDGDSIGTIENKQYYFASFNFRNNTVSMSVTTNHTIVDSLVFDEVWVLGLTSRPSSITASGATLVFTYYTDTRVLHIHGLSLPLKNNFSITWN